MCAALSACFGSRAQVNLEIMAVDRRSFVTGEQGALRALFGEGGSASASYRVAVASICARLAGLFASLKVGTLSHALFKHQVTMRAASCSAR